jgi:putative ABC transport system ATP-binding protein
MMNPSHIHLKTQHTNITPQPVAQIHEDVAIQLHEVRFAWPSSPLLLDIPQLNITRGEKVFVRGPSGCGKTSLLGLLGGVIQPQGGDIRILGQALTPLKQSARDAFRAAHIGFIFQLFNLLPYLSVFENVLLPCRFSAQRRIRAGTPAKHASHLLSHLQLPQVLWQRAVTELSVGQQQRVAVARALIGYPEIIIADEPTSALDSDTRDIFLDLLLQECRTAGTTVVFVSHDAALAKGFDRCFNLSHINRVSV